MFKSEIREKVIKTEEKVITVDVSIVDFCDWVYKEYGNDESIVSIILGIANRCKSVNRYECFYDEEPEDLFIEYPHIVTKNK